MATILRLWLRDSLREIARSEGLLRPFLRSDTAFASTFAITVQSLSLPAKILCESAIIGLTKFGNTLSFPMSVQGYYDPLPKVEAALRSGLYNFTIVNKKLPGGTPLKLKSLLVITLLAVACSFASAQTFGFASSSGSLYCNYEQLANGVDLTGAYDVVDNLSYCWSFYGISGPNATGGGFVATAANTGLPVFGKGVIYGDNLYDAFDIGYITGEGYYADPIYTGEQWTTLTKLKANKQDKYGHYKGSYSWIGLASYSTFVFGDNYGYLSATPPKAFGKADFHGTTAGKPVARPKK